MTTGALFERRVPSVLGDCCRSWYAADFRTLTLLLESKPRMISLQIFYEGNVQGIGFRWSVRYVAKGFDVTGWVRNLPDRRVELQVNGEEHEVRAFLDAIAQSELRAHIRKQSENKLEKPATVRGFEIRYD
jgi:acylphosphatase